ncbi:12771_t:CDS:2 [Entrophospora sp. SA101]|nr:14975_t:CDS:2 [Entrophospora sp. SA101]CAJ0844234.1 12771_t:CDS:2 [Entrophospora sp. SA101]
MYKFNFLNNSKNSTLNSLNSYKITNIISINSKISNITVTTPPSLSLLKYFQNNSSLIKLTSKPTSTQSIPRISFLDYSNRHSKHLFSLKNNPYIKSLLLSNTQLYSTNARHVDDFFLQENHKHQSDSFGVNPDFNGDLYVGVNGSGEIEPLYISNKTLTLGSDGKPIIDVENKDIEEIWVNYKKLSIEQILSLTVYDYNHLLASFLKHLSKNSSLINRMQSIINEMEFSKATEPDVSTYNIIMTAYIEIGDFLTMERFFFAVFKSDTNNIRPNTISYNILLSGLLNQKQKRFDYSSSVHKAARLFSVMVENNVERDHKTYTLLIKASGELKSYDMALQHFNNMIKEGLAPDVRVYNSLLNVIAKTQNEPATAMEKYNEMKSKGLQPTIVTYNILIGFMKKKKQNHLALELFEQMQKESIVPDAKILESVDITGLKAAKVLQEEYNVIPNIRDYNLMLSTELKRSDYDDALEIHKHMLNNKVKPNLSTYAIIIEDYVRSKETTNAFDIFNAMLKDNLETDIGIYTVLVNAYLEQNNLDMAFNLLDQMKSGVAEFKIGTLESIITTAAENSNEEFVEKIFSYLKSLGVIIDKSIYYILLNRLAKSPWPRYKLEYYIREMEENEVPVIRAVFFNIISGCCDVKNINEAEYWYNKMINVYQLIPNPKILTTLMYTFIDNRDLYNGINYFKEYFRWKAQLLEYEVMNLLDLCERLGARKALNYIINLLGENGYQEYVHKYEIRRQLIDNKMETINWLNRHVSSASNRNLKLFINKEKYAVKKNIIYKKLDHNAAIRIKNWKPYSENNKQ